VLKKIPFRCLVDDMRDCKYIEVTEDGFAMPVLEDELELDSDNVYFEVVQVVIEKDAGSVLVRPLCSFDEQEWDEISSARRIETNPEHEITQDPCQKLRDKYPSLVAAIRENKDSSPYNGMRVKVIGFANQAGIVEAVHDQRGDYVVDDLMVFVEKPYPAYWVHITLDMEEAEPPRRSTDPQGKVKIKVPDDDLDEEFDIEDDDE